MAAREARSLSQSEVEQLTSYEQVSGSSPLVGSLETGPVSQADQVEGGLSCYRQIGKQCIAVHSVDESISILQSSRS